MVVQYCRLNYYGLGTGKNICSYTSSNKKIFRRFIAMRQKKIKNTRRNQSLVYYHIARANSYFLVFIIICCLYLVWLISGSFLTIIKDSTLSGVVLSLPIYISEIVWLISDGYAKELAKSRGKIT